MKSLNRSECGAKCIDNREAGGFTVKARFPALARGHTASEWSRTAQHGYFQDHRLHREKTHLEWEGGCAKLGVEFKHYQLRNAKPAELIETCKDADIILVNMANLTREVIAGLESARVGAARHRLRQGGRAGDDRSRDRVRERGDGVGRRRGGAGDPAHVRDLQETEDPDGDVAGERGGESTGTSASGFYPVPHQGKDRRDRRVRQHGGHVLRKLRSFGVEFKICDPYLSKARLAELGLTHTPLDELLGRRTS